uniref:Transmembrane protein n=1 Tax=Trichobilharzia regenti TaxID=157069 RepID=A0AA85KMA1_TRIRE|nr:unnamed protein product [Trichobilharzia regenti]
MRVHAYTHLRTHTHYFCKLTHSPLLIMNSSRPVCRLVKSFRENMKSTNTTQYRSTVIQTQRNLFFSFIVPLVLVVVVVVVDPFVFMQSLIDLSSPLPVFFCLFVSIEGSLSPPSPSPERVRSSNYCEYIYIHY